jgi:AraC-like DNA-binding protein
MRKRSSEIEIRFLGVSLPELFPFISGDLYVQKDRPITFLHVHPCLELGYCYSGNGIFMVGEKVLPFRARDVSFIDRTEMHLARSAPGTESHWRWLYLNPQVLLAGVPCDLRAMDPSLYSGAGFHNLFSSAKYPEISRIVVDMIDEWTGRRKGYESALRALTWELMIRMGRLKRRLPRMRAARQPYDRLAPALQYLGVHYREPVDVGKLARSCSLSLPHFRRLFERTMGMAPRRYWLGLRLKMAASLLQSTGKPVLEISGDVGFETLSSFNRQFKNLFRVAPRKWRQLQEAGGNEKRKVG